jgi:hypothetical protein
VTHDNLVILRDHQAALQARVRAASQLGESDDQEVLDGLIALAADTALPPPVSEAVGASLAHIAHRLRDEHYDIRGVDENFMLRDFTEVAYTAYDRTTAELQRGR